MLQEVQKSTDLGSVKSTRYVVITPARDEQEHLPETIRCMVNQTVKPVQWIIVNDGSTDKTGEIIDRAAAEHPWISAFHVTDRGFRQPGTGVMATFYYGYQFLESDDWEFIVKLDGDLSFAPNYFEGCFEEFVADPSLGVGGGVLFCEENGTLREEVNPHFHVRGPTKIYRRLCWDRMGGLIKAPGWDTADELKANMLGWTSRSFRSVAAIHRRPTGAAQGSWRDAVKNGRADYIVGYHPIFMLVKSVRRSFEQPYFVDGGGHLWGYISGYLKGVPQVEDRALIRYTRRQQIRRLFLLKTIWK